MIVAYADAASAALALGLIAGWLVVMWAGVDWLDHKRRARRAERRADAWLRRQHLEVDRERQMGWTPEQGAE